ncbi:DUF551 domain-containing protein [Mycobacterium sp.]|uniref:DUF551 domain-containing protein n=1 Tax=Mycobacterium sp. TaxID=1785 RepID=UPI003A86A603
MNWISTKDKLPEEGKYVLARHNRGAWNDSTDQSNVNCVVVKLIRGLSKKDRQLMKEGKVPRTKEGGQRYNNNRDKLVYTESERHNIYKSEDEHGNNLVPYKWEMFGPDSFFGQSITHWMPIKPLK